MGAIVLIQRDSLFQRKFRICQVTEAIAFIRIFGAHVGANIRALRLNIHECLKKKECRKREEEDKRRKKQPNRRCICMTVIC